ncbi:MAG: DDE-type integrase/transposase/recombinase [Pyrinomonadaceae bacterium]
MRLTMEQRSAVVARTALRYKQAGKKEKGLILAEFIKLTEYARAYARQVLHKHGRRIRVDQQTVLVADAKKKLPGSKRPRVYDEKVVAILIKIWKIMDYICGKRLQPIMAELVTVLERHNELSCDQQTRAKLLRISAATIDRLLKPERRKYELRGRSRTKPGTLLKHQIPIRTFSEWDEQQPGFVEVDLVGHDGGLATGDYCQTLDMTDVATTWTETMAVKNKAQVWVFAALKILRKNLPFLLLGLDSDNGSEFINHELQRYCEQEKLTFTRSRPYRKNDNCFVEQKNYSVVRRAVGYQRYDTEEQLQLLNELYATLRLYTNFFQPTMKLQSKERVGSKVSKKYDRAQTPYQRVLAAPQITKQKKQQLRAKYETLNPAALKRKITRWQERLLKTTRSTKRLPARARKSSPTSAATTGRPSAKP